MKRIGDEKIKGLRPPNDGYSYYGEFGEAIAQTQLESCEKEHKAEIGKLFEEIEGDFFLCLKTEDCSGKKSVPAWQALKKRWVK